MRQKDLLLIGGGPITFGLAQTQSLNKKIGRIDVLARDPKVVSRVNKEHRHAKLKDVDIDERIVAWEMEPCLAERVNKPNIIIFLCVPTRSVREVATKIEAVYEGTEPLIVITVNKGIEAITHMFSHRIIGEVFRERAYHFHMSGASLAKGLASREFTINYLASPNFASAKENAELLSTKEAVFIPTDQVEGLEILGPLKNMGALMAGMTIGLGRGENARALIVGQVFREMTLFCKELGVTLDIPLGPGVEDLFLSASSEESNHEALGRYLGRRFVLEQDPRRRFKIYVAISALWARWKRRRQNPVIRASGELWRNVLVQAIKDGMHTIVEETTETILYPPSIPERVKKIIESSQRINVNIDELEGIYSVPSVRRISRNLRIQNELIITEQLYRYSSGEQDVAETIDNTLALIREKREEHSGGI